MFETPDFLSRLEVAPADMMLFSEICHSGVGQNPGAFKSGLTFGIAQGGEPVEPRPIRRSDGIRVMGNAL